MPLSLNFPPVVKFTAFLLLSCTSAIAHGDGHEGIQRLSQEIEAHPGQACLYMERATLFSQHGDYEKSLEDLGQVTALAPGNDAATALRGEVFRRMGRLKEARAEQEAFLTKYPMHALVRWNYCRTLAESKDTPAALSELDTLISASDHPSPDAVALRLSVTESSGPEGPANALIWLNGFLKKHPLPVFQEHALRLECQTGRCMEAFERLDAMIAAAPRKESLLLRKAALYREKGNLAEAAAAALLAMSAINNLPPHIRSTSASAALISQARQYLPAR